MQEEAFAVIINAIKDNTIYKMLNREFGKMEIQEPAIKAWKKLNQLVAQTSTASIQSLYEQLSKKKQEKGQPVFSYSEDLMSIVDQLESVGEIVSANFILSQFHSGLLPEYFAQAQISQSLGHNFKTTKLDLQRFETKTLSKKAKKGLGFGEPLEFGDKGMARKGRAQVESSRLGSRTSPRERCRRMRPW